VSRGQALVELAVCAPVVLLLTLGAVASVQLIDARAGLDAATKAAAAAAARAPDPATADSSARARFESMVAGFPLSSTQLSLSVGKFGRTDASLVSSENPLGLDPDDPDGKDDVVAVNQMHVAQGKPTVVTLSAKDVIHAFNIPVLRVKQDAIPGQSVPVWFEATQTGHFELACAQLCGLGHYRMRADVYVDTPEGFAKWQTDNAPGAPEAAAAPDAAPEKPAANPGEKPPGDGHATKTAP